MNLPPPAALASQLSRLGRPQNILYAGLLAAGTAWIGGAGAGTAAACFALIWTVYALAAAYNNLRDRQTDIINKRNDNPLTQASISRQVLGPYLAGHGALAVLLQFWLAQPTSILISAAFLLLSFAYSHPRLRLQARGWWATISLSICYGALPLLLGLAQSEGLSASLVAALALLQALLLFPLLAAKDYKDLKGDRATHKRTPLVRYGATTVRNISVAVAIVAGGLYAYILLKYHAAVDGTVLLAAAYVLYCAYLHTRKGRITKWQNKAATLLLLGMSLFAVALVLEPNFWQ